GGYLGVATSGDVAVKANLPTFEIHGRYGLGNNMDLGAKIYPIGTGIDFNYAIINNSNIAFSLNPSVAYVNLPSSSAVNSPSGLALTDLKVLVDFLKTDSVVLTAGAKGGGKLTMGGPTGGFQPTVGGTAGATFMLGDNFGLKPWFDGMYNIDNGIFSYNGFLAFEFNM
ncbi:MAG: hypothetical protein ABEN55_04715, partial [Bradymonadaceae bacterium]